MKKWYQWFYLSLAFAFGGILNHFSGRSWIAAVIQVSITVILGLIQFFCDRKGEKGRKAFRYISMVTAVLLALWLVYLLWDLLR